MKSEQELKPMIKEEIERMLGGVRAPTNTELKENLETVDHPQHYNREGAMECIDEMILLYGTYAVMDFCLCNAHKYRYRASYKNGEDDLKKSDWYINKYKELKNKMVNNDTYTYQKNHL